VYHHDSLRNPVKGLTIINYLFKGSDRDLFILTEKSIIRFDPLSACYTSHSITDGRKAYSNFMDMCETDQDYWVATYGDGVIQMSKDFKIKKVITTKEHLSNSCVYRVFRQENQILCTTNKGISVIDSRTYQVKNYFRQDGLHDNAFEQACGYQLGKKIYTGGVNGFTVIEPALFTRNLLPPRLYWKNIRINRPSGLIDTTHIALQNLQVPSDVLQTTISFSALNYANPTRVSYHYRIIGLNGDWISLAQQNFVNLIGLNPGTYTLQVKACNEDGICNKNPLQLTLLYLPKWHQTWWFKIALLLTGIVLAQFIQQYRISQLKKQQQIRKEIANDLHDDIGSTLNTIKNFTYLLKLEPSNREYLEKIDESLNTANYGLRDMIWVLDDTEDTVFALMDRIKRFALPACEANNIKFTGDTISEKVSRNISKTEKRNLFLIAKESINNSIKYSRCRHIKVIITQKKADMALVISDDGTGFDVKNVSGGNGLKNIRYRSEQIKWSLEITSETAGTTVSLTKKSQNASMYFLDSWQRIRSKYGV
jgi:signal transduction histidine kinase